MAKIFFKNKKENAKFLIFQVLIFPKNLKIEHLLMILKQTEFKQATTKNRAKIKKREMVLFLNQYLMSILLKLS